MGGDVDVIVVDGPDHLLDVAESMVDRLERQWSRFLPSSEITRLNDAGGRAVVVSYETFDLVERAVAASWATRGSYDPTVLPALVAAGYDRSFDDLGRAPTRTPSRAAPGCSGIRLDAATRSVSLPPGVALDPGGIGKGLAADLVVAELLRGGAAGACVNAGGDLRAAGCAPTADGWVVGVEHPDDPSVEVARLRLSNGGVATTSRLVRRWSTDGEDAHHVIDPTNGLPAVGQVVAATVVAGEAWWADVLAKMLFLLGPAACGSLLRRLGATGLAVLEDRRVVKLPGWRDYA